MREEWFGREVAGEMELSPLQWRDSISILVQDVQNLLPVGGLVIVDTDTVNHATVLSLLVGLHHALKKSGVKADVKASLLGRPELLTGEEQVAIVPFPGSVYGLQGAGLPDGKVVVIPASSAAYERLALTEPVTVPALPMTASGHLERRDTDPLKQALAAQPDITRQVFLAVALLDAFAAPPTYRLLANTFDMSEDDLEDIIVLSDGILALSESSDIAPVFVTIPDRNAAQTLLTRVPLEKRHKMCSKVLRHIDWQNATERQIGLHLPAGLLEKGERRLGIFIMKELTEQKVWQRAEPGQLVSWSHICSSYRLYSFSLVVLDYSLQKFPASHDLWSAKLTIVSRLAVSKPDMVKLAQDVYQKIIARWPDDDKAKMIRAKLELLSGNLDKAGNLLRVIRKKALPSSSSPLFAALNHTSRTGWGFPGLLVGGAAALRIAAGAVALLEEKKGFVTAKKKTFAEYKDNFLEMKNAFAVKKQDKRKPDHATLTQWQTQAEIAKSRGDSKNAILWFTTLLEHGQQTIRSSVSLAEIALQEGNLNQVIDYTGQVLAKDAENPDALWTRAQALLTLAKDKKRADYREQAVQDLELLLEVDPEKAEARTLYETVGVKKT